jgi:hypothetical protein
MIFGKDTSETMPRPRAFVRPYRITAPGTERDRLNGFPVSRTLRSLGGRSVPLPTPDA